MKAAEFVGKIFGLKPIRSDFNNTHFSVDLIEDWIKQFEIKKIANNDNPNEIMNLLLNYNVAELRINDITFDSDYQEDDQYIFFGWDVLPNRIAIYKNSGKIVSYDPGGDKIDFLCAENSEKFLDAMFEIMQFSNEKMLKYSIYTEEDIDERSLKVAYIAALKAGGEEYEDYYKSILWVE